MLLLRSKRSYNEAHTLVKNPPQWCYEWSDYDTFIVGSCDDFKQSPYKSGHMMTFSSDCQPPTSIGKLLGLRGGLLMLIFF